MAAATMKRFSQLGVTQSRGVSIPTTPIFLGVAGGNNTETPRFIATKYCGFSFFVYLCGLYMLNSITVETNNSNYKSIKL